MLQPITLSCFLLLVLTNVGQILCVASKCVVVAPRSIRSNSDYTLSIATHGAAEPMQFRVKIYEREEPSTNKTLTYRPNKKNVYQDSTDQAVKKGPKPKLMQKTNNDRISKDDKSPITGSKTKTVIVQPNLPLIVKFNYNREIILGSYVLEVVSLSSSADSAFYEKLFLSVESDTFSTFIHSNKASYRPGDLCKYRIIVVDTETRPVAIDSSLNINIYDSSRSLVHMKTKQSAKKGVYSGEYQIPGRSKLGVWLIEVEYSGKRISKQIEVTKTERPNFQVIARTPTFVSNNSTQFSVGVESYYSFGKPITGVAVIKATPILQSSNTRTLTAKPVTITKDVRGIYFTTFQMSDFMIPKLWMVDSFLIETTVQEKATGVIVRGYDKTIPMDYKRIPGKYDISLYYFGFFLAGQAYSIKVHVHAKSGMALTADLQSVKLAVAFDSDITDASTYTTYDLDGNGKTEVMVQVPATTMNKVHFKVRHGESSEEVTVLAKKLHVQVINPSNPKLNQKIQFQVGCRQVPTKLSFYIVGRGNVLVSQVVDMAGKNVGVFEFDSTLAMAPSSSLVVYYVSDAGEIISDDTEFNFEPEILANPLNVTVSETRLKPNQELTVTMKTGDNSQISMSAVDQNVLLESQGNDLSRNKVFNGLRLYDNAGDMDLDASYADSYSRLLKSGSLVLTDAMKFKAGTLESNNITTVRRDISYDYTQDIQTNIVIPLLPTCSYINLTVQEQQDLQNTTAVRAKFVDTLLWQDVEHATGVSMIKTTVPETVTSWILTGYSLSTTTGLGFVQTPVVLTTFKPFFIDVRVPCSCKMGDTIDVQVTVHNYMDQVARVEVTLDDSAGDFDIITQGRAFGDYVEYDEYYELRNLKQIALQVVGDGVRSTTFSVKPKKVGPMKLKVQTISSVACDTMEKTITVDPPGKTITRTDTRPIFLDALKPKTVEVFQINIPPNAVPGSVKIQVAIQGDKYALVMENQQPLKTDDLDVLSTIASQGLNVFGPQLNPGCQSSTALSGFLNAANNFLKGQCSDGGFRIDGDCDQPLRDATFTARTLLGTSAAVRFNVTSSVSLFKGLDWLARVQRADGSFPNPIPYPDVFVEGPITTSYILYAFLFANNDIPVIRVKYATTISKAMDNLFSQVDNLDILSLTFLTRSAQLALDPRKSIAFAKLSALSHKSELTQRWTRSPLLDEALPYINIFYRWESDILAMARVTNGLVQYLVDYFEQLSTPVKNNLIFYANTFYEYFSIFSASTYQMKVSFPSGNETTTVAMDFSSKALQSTFEIDPTTRALNVTASGLGLATVELTYEYNLMPESVVDAYLLYVAAGMSTEWRLNICVGSKLTPHPAASVMNIKFPPGFNTTEFVQDNDALTPKIKRKDLKGDSMTVYFEGLDDKLECLVVPLYRKTFVEQPLVGSVTIQDQDLKNEKPHISIAEYTLSSFDSTEILGTTV